MLDAMLAWDKTLFLLINHDWSHPFLDALFVTITSGRFWIIPGIAAALIFLRVEKRRALLVLLLSAVTVTLTDPLGAQLIKPLAHRLRPCNPDYLLEGGRFLIGLKPSFSFPSNHAMNMFGQAMLFTLFYPRLSPLFFLFAGVIGYSRIYVGVHYPTDVVGGAVLGIFCGIIVFFGYRITYYAIKRKRTNAGKYS
jgi:undecaprenyl-diphosphatase